MNEKQEQKPKRRQKQLYFGKRDDQLWEWVQSLPSQEGNAEICQILNYYLYGGVKPKTPSYWDNVEKQPSVETPPKEDAQKGNKSIQDTELNDDLLK